MNISLMKGKPPQYIRAVADGIHQAMQETYNVPQADRFQTIHQLDQEHLIYDAEYLGIHRSDDIVIVHIVAGRWRDTAMKKAFYKRATELLAEKPGCGQRMYRSFCLRMSVMTGPSGMAGVLRVGV